MVAWLLVCASCQPDQVNLDLDKSVSPILKIDLFSLTQSVFLRTKQKADGKYLTEAFMAELAEQDVSIYETEITSLSTNDLEKLIALSKPLNLLLNFDLMLLPPPPPQFSHSQ